MTLFRTLADSRNPDKAKLSAEIAEQTAAWEAIHGPVVTTPIKALSHDGLNKANGKTHLNLSSERPEIDPARAFESYRRGGKAKAGITKVRPGKPVNLAVNRRKIVYE